VASGGDDPGCVKRSCSSASTEMGNVNGHAGSAKPPVKGKKRFSAAARAALSAARQGQMAKGEGGRQVRAVGIIPVPAPLSATEIWMRSGVAPAEFSFGGEAPGMAGETPAPLAAVRRRREMRLS